MPSNPARRHNKTFDGAMTDKEHLIQSRVRCDDKKRNHRARIHAGLLTFFSRNKNDPGKTTLTRDTFRTRTSNACLGVRILILLNIIAVLVIWCSLATTKSLGRKSQKKQMPLRIRAQLFDEWLSNTKSSRSAEVLPPRIAKDLIDRHFYDPHDFVNDEQGTYVPYWWRIKESDRNTETILDDNRWGPCFPPLNENEVLDYCFRQKSVEAVTVVGNKSDSHNYRLPDECKVRDPAQSSSLDGMCLPGYLIVGAGKCGTSSLYHHLIEHPRVAPARQKQIGYYKYFPDKSLKCYLSFFPNVQEFMSTGALITGEAFPGYLPYPDVAPLIQNSLVGGGGAADHRTNGPKIVVTVREPLSRAYSSYKYNYLKPALQKLRAGRLGPNRPNAVPVNQSDSYYMQRHLFSFQELAGAELGFLLKCLAPGGRAEQLSHKHYSSSSAFNSTFSYRKAHNLAPLVDVELCYGEKLLPTIKERLRPGPQFQDLIEAYPNKLIDIPRNNHLIRSFLGRSLYGLALEWWYGVYDEKHLHIVCMEEMNSSTAALHNITAFLGLPVFDYSETLAKGRYNVGGQEGYDTLMQVSQGSVHNSVPISIALDQDIQTFFSQHNERLFELMKRRCPW